jgi:hypothetical protein
MSNLKHAVAMNIISTQNIADPKAVGVDGKKVVDARSREAQGVWPCDGDGAAYLAEIQQVHGYVAALEIVEIGAALYFPKRARLFTDKAGGKITDAKCDAWITAHGWDDGHAESLRGKSESGRRDYARAKLVVGVATADHKDASDETVRVVNEQQKARKDAAYKDAEKKDAVRAGRPGAETPSE